MHKCTIYMILSNLKYKTTSFFNSYVYMDEKNTANSFHYYWEDVCSSIIKIHLGGMEEELHLWHVKVFALIGANTVIMEHVLKHIYSLLLECL